MNRTPLLEELEIMLSAAIYWDSEDEGREHVSELLADAYATLIGAINAVRRGDVSALVSGEKGGAE